MAIVEPEPLTLSVAEAARKLGISRRFAYEMAAAGELPTVKLGHKLLVPKAALDRFLAGEPLTQEPA